MWATPLMMRTSTCEVWFEKISVPVAWKRPATASMGALAGADAI
jgi:hypothetical protein